MSSTLDKSADMSGKEERENKGGFITESQEVLYRFIPYTHTHTKSRHSPLPLLTVHTLF